MAEKLLQKLGVTMEAAEDGLQAVAKVSGALTHGQVFHLVLLDTQMPKLDGYQTAEELRELGYANPSLALTADAMQGDMNRCIACGCNDYLSKPIDARLLAQKVYQLTKTLED
ncbi:response regulator [Planctomycetaceae bacterium SH139]